MTFAARQLQEKCREQNRDLYTTFMDLTKAFDIVSRDVSCEGHWRVMVKFGCTGKFISMVHQLQNSMFARVVDDEDSSKAFPLTNRVKQG
ncbi:hypothetical protein NDU88_007181 [Pleurodeles waltl]|uniref:Reverse transcriptase domain-containing protein n=1 Tax=Pleurodeles waltl TaxID=8319 RepID=A0AAV7UN46_PLEWA|nr:hypothetical protein NDU88_007181 [Pleurodeles waltl]